MARTARDLTYTNGKHVLLRYNNGEQALWVEAPDAREDGRGYTINDINERIDLGDDEDIDGVIADWQHNVEWSGGDD